VSRHHMLPPIIYMPAPPKPKETRRRRGVGNIQGKGATDETEEASEVSVAAGPARPAAPPRQDPFARMEGAERRIPSTTGKLSENTLKELLLAQEQQQESAPETGSVTPAAKVDHRDKPGDDG
jgi:hypothetical protein